MMAFFEDETCGGRPGFVIGALKRIGGAGALSANCEATQDVPGSTLHERISNLSI